jgi:hypothetical protein
MCQEGATRLLRAWARWLSAIQQWKARLMHTELEWIALTSRTEATCSITFWDTSAQDRTERRSPQRMVAGAELRMEKVLHSGTV